MLRGVSDAGGPSRLWELRSSARGNQRLLFSLRSRCVSALRCLLCRGGPWVLAGARAGSTPCAWSRRRKPMQALSQWHRPSRGPSRGGCTHRRIGACVYAAGPPTPGRGQRAGRGSDHSAPTGRAARGQEGGGLGGESRPHPSASPGPVSAVGRVGLSPLRCPRGRRAGLFGSHDQGPRAPSLHQPLSAAPSRTDVPVAPERTQPSTALRSR